MRLEVDTAGERVLWYLCLEQATEGQASHTHVTGILRGLSSRGWSTILWQPPARREVRGPLRRLFESMTTQARLMAHRGRPDILYVRGHFASLAAVLWARLRGIPVVWEVNGPSTDVLSSWPQARPLMPLLRASVAWQLRLSAAAIAVTAGLCQDALRDGARRCHVVSNGADVELFAPTATCSQVLPDRFVSFTGTLATWQGVDSLLAAIDYPSWPKDVSIVVIGDGVLAHAVRERSLDDPRVRYLGRLPLRDVGGVVARSICAVSPKSARDHGRTGVVPLKLFEAMACGVPVVVTDLPGQADIVAGHCCGLVVPPDDPAAICDAVATLAADANLARLLGERGRTAAVDKFSWDAAAGKTHEILLGLARR